MIKKLTVSTFLCLVMLLSTFNSFAITNAELFNMGDVSIESQFEPLNDLEEVLIANPEADMNFVVSNFSEALAKVNFAEATALPSLPLAPMEDRPALGIPGWVWGACLLGVGILAVYLILDDASQEYRKKQTIQALIGCVGGAILWTVVPAVFFAGSYWWLWF